MGGSVFGVALSGLNAAKTAITTISHNISNSNSPDYSRQEVIQGARDAQGFGFGFVGQGVDVKDIRRSVSSFVNAQYQLAISDAGYFEGYESQISRVDTLFADAEAGLSTAISGFFGSVQDMSTNPNDGATRQNVISTTEALASRFNALDQSLKSLRDSTNTKINLSVSSINEITRSIASLNREVIVSGSTGGSKNAPNDLFDRRDGLVRQLAEQLQVTTVPASDGTVNVFLANGQAMVVRDRSTPITAQQDPVNPEDFQLGLKLNPGTPQETNIRFIPSDLGKGSLSGFLAFREGPLTQFQNTLGLISMQLGTKINEVNRQGFDQAGMPGADLINVNGSRTVSNLLNDGDGQLAVSTIDLAKISGRDYELAIVGGVLSARPLGSRDAFDPVPQVNNGGVTEFQLEGAINFGLSGTPAEGDLFVLFPTRDAARNFNLLTTDPSKIAAALEPNKPGDNRNLLEMAALQSKEVLYQGSPGARGSSILTAFNQLVSQIGNKTREISLGNEVRQAVLDQTKQQQQSTSGVNLDEEAAELLKYQQAYQASGRVISLSKELFDLLVRISGQ